MYRCIYIYVYVYVCVCMHPARKNAKGKHTSGVLIVLNMLVMSFEVGTVERHETAVTIIQSFCVEGSHLA